MGQSSLMIVDDDPSLRALVRDFLVTQGYRVHEAGDAVAMRQVLATTEIEIVILDVMMPGEDGLSIARSLVQDGGMGIIMVSALGSETDRIIGLEMGADDYLPKPVSPRELLARIRALQRRRHFLPAVQRGVARYAFEGWQLDPVRRQLRDPGGIVIGLSEGEFSLLLAFVEYPRRVLSRDQLLELARGSESDAFDRAIDTQVSRLRRKLTTRMKKEIIHTIRNEGYMFMPDVSRK